MKIKLLGVGAALALAATAVTAVAIGAANNSGLSLDKKQLTANMTVDGVEGGDPASTSLEISSWSWGVSNSSTGGSGGGGGAGKATLGSLNITKVIDKASPKLALLCASGEHIPTVTLTLLRPGTSSLPYLEIKLTNAIVSSVQHSGSGDSQPQEQVTFNYQRVDLKYTTVDGNLVQARLDESRSF